MYLDSDFIKTMQVVSPSSPAPRFVGKDRFAEVYGKLSDDFGSKLKMEEEEENRHNNNNNLEESWWKEDDDEEEEEEEEFSFTNLNAEKSPISAEEAFEDGQIRPVYPLFNRDLLFENPLRSPLKKVFVESEETAAEEEESEEPTGPFCSWSGRTVEEEEASPETCRKSNSTGFSKLRRFRDLVLRSNSDGRDAFVFFNADKNNNNQSSSSSRVSGVKKEEKGKEEKATTVERKKKRTMLSAHERLYMRNRALKEEGKRRSYLPYKHVGFFTNVNVLTRNVHPY